MKKITVSALSLVIALAAGSAFANDHEMPMPPKDGMNHEKMGGKMFQENDTDGDGFISKAEWTAKGDKMFSETDGNGDGKISKEEMKAKHENHRAKMKERHEEKAGMKEERREKMKEHMEKKAGGTEPAPATTH